MNRPKVVGMVMGADRRSLTVHVRRPDGSTRVSTYQYQRPVALADIDDVMRAAVAGAAHGGRRARWVLRPWAGRLVARVERWVLP